MTSIELPKFKLSEVELVVLSVRNDEVELLISEDIYWGSFDPKLVITESLFFSYNFWFIDLKPKTLFLGSSTFDWVTVGSFVSGTDGGIRGSIFSSPSIGLKGIIIAGGTADVETTEEDAPELGGGLLGNATYALFANLN